MVGAFERLLPSPRPCPAAAGKGKAGLGTGLRTAVAYAGTGSGAKLLTRQPQGACGPHEGVHVKRLQECLLQNDV